MTKRVNIHATCVRIGRHGVLLLGKSGAGKSDLALRLIGRGAVLVADDRCDLSVERGKLTARPPKTVAGLLEIRGVGIHKLPYAVSAAIALVVDLGATVARLPEPDVYEPPLSLRPAAKPPRLALNAFEASSPDKIVAALGLLAHGKKPQGVKRN
jgi:serine kinase of HPr protein (carbohydrate metabolism regulator)